MTSIADLAQGRKFVTLELMSIRDAAAKGIERLRQPRWVNPLDHIKIDLVAGEIGPWVHLWCPYNTECNKRDPVDMLILEIGPDKIEWLPYTGPREDSDEYKAAVALCKRNTQ